MKDVIDIVELLKEKHQWQIIDVRSPCEFAAGHIPGAVNIPLFSDEERARVGTLYKQVSPEAAMTAGLKIAGQKMGTYLEAAQALVSKNDKELAIHCWRGGKRSQAIQWLYSFSGLKATRLTQGYKSFRNALHAFFAETPFEFKILGGYTGSGKTEILHELAKNGHQVIDLEKIAGHKGSAFGSIGENEQSTNEQFENDLYLQFLNLDPDKPIWIENESKNIGKVYLPDTLWAKMRSSVLYSIEVDRDVRLNRALQYYSVPADGEALKAGFDKIRKRLGNLDYQEAIKALEMNDIRTAASIALKYYDKSYCFQISQWHKDRIVLIPGCDDIQKAAQNIIESSNIII